MGNPINLSASMPVRRIIDGDTLSLYFTTNGVPLFQGYNPDAKTVSPVWNKSGSHPVITPHVGSARQNPVQLLGHRWSYNGVEIKFASGSGTVASTNFSNLFELNTNDGSLSIIGNLASAQNQDSDVVKYEGTASVGDSSYTMEKSIDILVSMLGGSAYTGGIVATSTMLGVVDDGGNQITSTKLSFWLMNSAGVAVTSFKVKLFRGDVLAADKFDGTQGISVHRDSVGTDDKLYVDSHQLFVAEFYVDGVNDAVYRAGIGIDDAADLYKLNFTADRNGVKKDFPMTVKCTLVNTKTNSEATVTNGKLSFYLLNTDGYSVVKSKDVSFTKNEEFKAASFTVSLADITKTNTDGSTSYLSTSINANLFGQAG